MQCFKKIKIKISNKKFEDILLIKPNFSKNRFDIIYGNNFEVLIISDNNETIYVPIHVNDKLCIIGLYLTYIPKSFLKSLIKYIFENNEKIDFIQITHSIHYIWGLSKTNQYIVDFHLYDSIIAFEKALSKKTRYNTKWYPKKLIKDFGSYNISIYNKTEISDDIIDAFISMKSVTHPEAKYNIRGQDFLKYYFITKCYIMHVNNEVAGVIFLCSFEDADFDYFDAITYNAKYAKYSVGSIIWYKVLSDHLENKSKKGIILGGGNLEYKRRYNGIEHITYTGKIKRWTRYFL